MYNYWSYGLFLLNKVFRYRHYKSHKWLISKYRYGAFENDLAHVYIPKNNIMGMFDFKSVVAYRVHWNDGTISPWFSNKGGALRYIGKQHAGEVLVKR